METGKLSHNFKELEYMKPVNTIENLIKFSQPNSTQRKVKLANN